MNMARRITPIVRLASSLALVAALVGCNATKHRIPTDQKATPVEPVVIVIELTSDKTVMSTTSDDVFAMLKLVAYDARTWDPLPNGTDVKLTTNLGNLQSMSGPQTLTLELFDGMVNSQFHAGDEVGLARITAEVLGVVDLVEIQIIE
jgi:hypothetical protein